MACAACCAGPIVGLLTAAGLATVGGFVMFGTIALVVSAVITALILATRSRERPAGEVPVEITEHPTIEPSTESCRLRTTRATRSRKRTA